MLILARMFLVAAMFVALFGVVVADAGNSNVPFLVFLILLFIDLGVAIRMATRL